MLEMERKLVESYINVECEEYQDGVKTIGDCLKYYADRLGNAEAIVFASCEGADREAITWNDVYYKSVNMAKSLVALGIKPKESVVINLQTCPEWIYITFGTILAGALPLGLDFNQNDGGDLLSATKQLRTCAMLVLDPGCNGKNWAIAKRFVEMYSANGDARSCMIPQLRYLIGHNFHDVEQDIKQLHDLLSVCHSDAKLPEATGNDVAVLFATSGSTGASKIAAHTHASMLSGRKMVDRGVYNRRHIFFNCDPFHWIGSFPFHLFYGQKRVTTTTLSKDEHEKVKHVIKVIDEERCTVMLAWAVTLSTMLHDQVKLPVDWPIEIIETTGQPMHESLRQAVGSLCKGLACSYGSTEHCLGTSTTIFRPDNFQEYNCGRPVDMNGYEMKVVDFDGNILPVNTIGELLIRGPGMFKEYYNNESRTAAVKTKDGWLKTDDLARINEHGELFVEGRVSNMIITKGDKVVPESMEAVFRLCPGVQDVLIVPVPDTACYQLLCACIIRENGDSLTEEDVRRFAENYYNIETEIVLLLPTYYLFLESFPKTSTGKTSRKKLQTIAENVFTNERLCN